MGSRQENLFLATDRKDEDIVYIVWVQLKVGKNRDCTQHLMALVDMRARPHHKRDRVSEALENRSMYYDQRAASNGSC